MNVRVHIRPATPEDADAIQSVVASRMRDVVERPTEADLYLATLTFEATLGRLTSTSYRGLVAVADGSVVGVAVMRDLGHLYHLFVSRDWEGLGIGGRLWTACITMSRAAGHAGAFTVNASQNAVSVYQALGFKETADPIRANGLKFTPMALNAEAEGHARDLG